MVHPMNLVAFLTLILATTSPSVAAFMPECSPPRGTITEAFEADGSSLEYLQTMIRIELEGEAVAARVLRGALGPEVIIRSCGSEAGKLLALGPQE